MSCILEVQNLKSYYNMGGHLIKAVDGVDFTLEKEEVLGIAGESACGKTTLAKSILRILEQPGYIHSGRIFFHNSDLTELDDEALRQIRGKDISYIPQSSMNALNPCSKIEQQVVETIMAHGKYAQEKAKERVFELLRMVGLPKKCATMYPHELSGGMKQRAVIALAVCLHPEIVIADEPTTALDVVVQRRILQLLEEIKSDLHVSIILISHDVPVLMEIADRLAIMYAGKMVEMAEVEDIFENPLHPYTRALISAVPDIRRKQKLNYLSGRPPSLLNPPPGCRFHPRCLFAKDICITEEPIIRLVGPKRLVACHQCR